MSDRDSAEKEYLDVSANLRQYGNMRFAQMTLMIAATGAIIATLAGHDKPLADGISFLLKLAGLVITVAFWIMEERAADYWHHYVRRAIRLEETLGFEQYSKRPAKKVLTATNATRLLYSGAFVMWTVTLFSGRRIL